LSVIKIIRPNLEICHNDRFHESESQHLQFNFDQIIQNVTLEEYKQEIDKIMKSFE